MAVAVDSLQTFKESSICNNWDFPPSVPRLYLLIPQSHTTASFSLVQFSQNFLLIFYVGGGVQSFLAKYIKSFMNE